MYDSALKRGRDGFRPVGHAKFAKDAFQVVLHRVFGNVQRVGDFLVASPWANSFKTCTSRDVNSSSNSRTASRLAISFGIQFCPAATVRNAGTSLSPVEFLSTYPCAPRLGAPGECLQFLQVAGCMRGSKFVENQKYEDS
jgi:hypothetical protein